MGSLALRFVAKRLPADVDLDNALATVGKPNPDRVTGEGVGPRRDRGYMRRQDGCGRHGSEGAQCD